MARLRKLKGRYAKPLAVMYRDEATATDDLALTDEERRALTSWRRPIVVSHERAHHASWLNEGYRSLGALLPYMAIHYDLFEAAPRLRRMVVTSANLSGNPIVIADGEAHDQFDSQVELVVSYNREIYNRIDDSVVCEYDGLCRPVRRARGYTPEPLHNLQPTEGILAVGAEQVSSFAVGKHDDVLSRESCLFRRVVFAFCHAVSFHTPLCGVRPAPRLCGYDVGRTVCRRAAYTPLSGTTPPRSCRGRDGRV